MHCNVTARLLLGGGFKEVYVHIKTLVPINCRLLLKVLFQGIVCTY